MGNPLQAGDRVRFTERLIAEMPTARTARYAATWRGTIASIERTGRTRVAHVAVPEQAAPCVVIIGHLQKDA